MKYYTFEDNRVKQFKIFVLMFLFLSRLGIILGIEVGENEDIIFLDEGGYKITNKNGSRLNCKIIEDEAFFDTVECSEATIKEGNIEKTLITKNDEDGKYYKMLKVNGDIAINPYGYCWTANDLDIKEEKNIKVASRIVVINEKSLNEDYPLDFNIKNNNTKQKEKIEKYLKTQFNFEYKILSRNKRLDLIKKITKNKEYFRIDNIVVTNEKGEPLLYETEGNKTILYIKFEECNDRRALSLAGLSKSDIENEGKNGKIILKIVQNENEEDSSKKNIRNNNTDLSLYQCCNYDSHETIAEKNHKKEKP